jgi:uncharacterized protein YecT (DUF1311 family)
MPSILRLCFLIALLSVCINCSAQHMNAKNAPCRVPSSGAEETVCFANALQKADTELNRMYQRVETVVDGENLAKLRTAQRLWIQFRDANCDAEHELYYGGSAAPMVKFACLEAMTRHRTEELEIMYGGRLENWRK